jgi:hypothetical protein
VQIEGKPVGVFVGGKLVLFQRSGRERPQQSGEPGLDGGDPVFDSSVRPGYEQIRVTIRATGDFDDDQFADLASLTRYSPVRDIVRNPVPVAIDATRG